ncbi:sensor histidine kinase [Puerhibacterium puerhi]|uniref:sensor histidine kinase n=1 Tax=Puerhibacterium puerhi TaxID=2692623 RepID=UPI001F3C8EF1|nr:histidine kinase [Puerhibacterium puerhi]
MRDRVRPDEGASGAAVRRVDALLGVGVALAVAVVVLADLDATGRAGPAALAFAAGFGLLAAARRTAPRALLVATVLGIFGYYVLQLPPIGIALPAVVALYSAAEAGRTGWALGAGAVLVGVAAWARIDEGLPATYLASYDLLTDVALVVAAVALGVSVRARRETRAHQERLRAAAAAEQARAGEQRLQEERVRIARDLHDVVGHTLSVISVHGNVAAEALDEDDAAARAAVGQILRATSTAMRELRTTVKVLRSPAQAPERGTIGLGGVAALADAARAAGLRVELDVAVPADALDGVVDAAAYRIVQESLTNTLRHAGATRAVVTAAVRGDRLEVTVTDDGHGRARPAGTGGAGLAGMAERAAAVGGRLAAGDGPDGGFRVHATMPARLR